MTPRWERLTMALLAYALVQLVWNTWELRKLIR